MTDLIIKWRDVRDGDQVLVNGHLGTATVMPLGNAWRPEGHASLIIDGSWRCPKADDLTAVRREAAS